MTERTLLPKLEMMHQNNKHKAMTNEIARLNATMPIVVLHSEQVRKINLIKKAEANL